MAVLRSLLAMYGAFDQVATQTQDPEMRAMVEKILPGTTGPGQRGWYKEIQDFVRRNARLSRWNSRPRMMRCESSRVARALRGCLLS